jgi:hypothetical protein
VVPAAAPELDIALLPPATTDVTRPQLALGAFAQPWPGAIAVTDDATGSSVASLSGSATLGVLTGALAAGSIFVWDDINAIELTVYSGHLSSRDDDEVLAGANRIAVATDAGDWEVIGFANADLIGPQSYRLTRLLRGQMGTDWAIGPAAAGNAVLLLDSRATLLPVSPAWLGTTVDLRSFAGPADAVGEVTELALGLDPVLPLAPVHVNALRRPGSSDVALAWVRRSRSDTDSWAADDAPLDCVPEAYRVTIYNGLSVVRSLDVSSPATTYTTAQQTTDFGSPPTGFSFTVAQTSPLYGPGHAASGAFHA